MKLVQHLSAVFEPAASHVCHLICCHATPATATSRVFALNSSVCTDSSQVCYQLATWHSRQIEHSYSLLTGPAKTSVPPLTATVPKTRWVPRSAELLLLVLLLLLERHARCCSLLMLHAMERRPQRWGCPWPASTGEPDCHRGGVHLHFLIYPAVNRVPVHFQFGHGFGSLLPVFNSRPVNLDPRALRSLDWAR